MGSKRRRRAPGRRQDENQEAAEAATTQGIDWRDHVGVAVGLSSLAYVAFRILAVSNYSLETAYALVQETGAANVGLGAMLGSIPVLAGICWLAGVVLQARDLARREAGPVWRWPALTLLTVLSAFMVPIGLMVAFMVLGLLVLAVENGASDIGEPGKRRSFYISLGILLTLTVVPSVISQAPWFPPERIKVQGQPAFTAYVLAEEGGTATLLAEEPREVLRVEESRLRSRRICHLKEEDPIWDVLLRPLWAQFTGKPGYPLCPSAGSPSG